MMDLYVALLPFSALVCETVFKFEYCGIYVLPRTDPVTAELVRLNAMKKIEFDGDWKPSPPK